MAALFSPEQTISVVETAKHAHVREIPPYHYGAVFERPAA
jgi:hypothetical protein